MVGKFCLIGGFNPPEKYEFVSWEYYSQYMEKCSKPPTRYVSSSEIFGTYLLVDLSQYMEKTNHVPNHQPEMYLPKSFIHS